jgi:hypothetical protein
MHLLIYCDSISDNFNSSEYVESDEEIENYVRGSGRDLS